MKKILLTTILCLGLLFCITGCGTDDSNEKVLKALNDSVSILVDEWNNAGHKDIIVDDIQKHLDDYTIINSSKSEYLQTDGSTEYTKQMIGSSNFSSSSMMISGSDINYILVYDKNNQKYYNVEIKYKEVTFKEQYKYDIPYFNKANELN